MKREVDRGDFQTPHHRQYWLRKALEVCACEACCRLQPWRREVVKRHQRQLQRINGKGEMR